MKSVIKALLAASMLMPIAAQAQEQDGRERGQGRRGEWGQRADRPQRSAEVGVEAQVRSERPQRAEFRAERQRQRQRPEARTDAPRGDREGRNRERPTTGQQDWNRGDDRRGDRDTDGRQAGNGWRQPDRDGRQQLRPAIRDDRQTDRRAGYAQGFTPGRGNWQGYEGRGGDWRGGDRRDWNNGRRYDNRGGVWNRGWRNDTRYDWNRNRQVDRSAYRLPRYYAPSGWGYGYRRFSVGIALSSILFSQNYWIDDPFSYRLPEAYGPYRWVRYYDDALLVDIRSGQVVDTVYDIFY